MKAICSCLVCAEVKRAQEHDISHSMPGKPGAFGLWIPIECGFPLKKEMLLPLLLLPNAMLIATFVQHMWDHMHMQMPVAGKAMIQVLYAAALPLPV